jgi:RNA polymerase sigma-70 factor, ECF subfamily
MAFVFAWLASLLEADPTLAERIAAGDQVALRRLYDRMAGRVRAIALRVLGQPGDADDVVQDTFVEVWNRASQFDPKRGSLVTWVTTIAHHRAVDRLRRRATRPTAAATSDVRDELSTVPAVTTTPQESAEHGQARERVQRALAALTPEQREAIELMYFGGLSQSEAAEQLGQALGTFKSRVRAAMAQLSQLLDELGPEVSL